jgi:hypothetical protein
MKLYQRLLAVVVCVPLIVLISILVGELRTLADFGLKFYFEKNTILLISLVGIAASIALLTVVLVFSLSRVMMYYFDRYWSR